jgi:16S rRNA (uracil1498-N3)-methyltransferase
MPALFIAIVPEDVHGAVLVVGGAQHHHLTRVRRVAVGAALRAALPDGRVLRAEITRITGTTLEARVLGEEPPAGVSPCAITLYQAVLKGERMEWVIQKAVELGVTAIVPLNAARSIPRWTDAQARERVARWQRIAEAAAEQSERSLPPRVEPLAAFPGPDFSGSLRLLLHERAGVGLRAVAAEHQEAGEIALYLGPEGGWEEGETGALQEAGAIPIHLGGRVLRAETATLAALALVQYCWGDLGQAIPLPPQV